MGCSESQIASVDGQHMSQTLTAKQKLELCRIANTLLTPGKGILAADEKMATVMTSKHHSSRQKISTKEFLQMYRELIVSAEDLNYYISGVILIENNAWRMNVHEKVEFFKELERKGILPGIRIDRGMTKLSWTDGEYTTEGLDNLGDRCLHYKLIGVQFAKWRTVFKINQDTPSHEALEENAYTLARFATICQHHGILPIIEPEVMNDGQHTIEIAQSAIEQVLSSVYRAIIEHNVFVEGTVLETNMVTAGKGAKPSSTQDIVRCTVEALTRAVPAAVPGIILLSGNQTEEEASINLDAMNKFGSRKPWVLTFFFSGLLQKNFLDAWRGRHENKLKAHKILIDRLKANGDSSLGKYALGIGGTTIGHSLFIRDRAY